MKSIREKSVQLVLDNLAVSLHCAVAEATMDLEDTLRQVRLPSSPPLMTKLYFHHEWLLSAAFSFSTAELPQEHRALRQRR